MILIFPFIPEENPLRSADSTDRGELLDHFGLRLRFVGCEASGPSSLLQSALLESTGGQPDSAKRMGMILLMMNDE